jgi:NADPH-dependent F420 reductase
MKVAIIGSGNVGTALARATKDAGHEVTVAGQTEEKLSAVGEAVGARTTTSNTVAVEGADVVVLAVPFAAAEGVIEELSDRLDGTILVDVTNPVKGDLSGLATEGVSAAEIIQRAAPTARVVKAFNTVFASNQADPTVDGVALDGFVAGDDPDAKAFVVDLFERAGYRPIDVGPLTAARYLEGMAFLNIWLNASNGWSWQTGWKLLGPAA